MQRSMWASSASPRWTPRLNSLPDFSLLTAQARLRCPLVRSTMLAGRSESVGQLQRNTRLMRNHRNSQIRPLTGAADRMESYQMQFGENMSGRWIDDKDL